MFEQLDDRSDTGPHLVSPVVTDRVTTTTAFLPPPSPASRRPDRSAAQPVTDRKLRRLYGWETWVVLSIFPLGATIAAITYLLMHITIGVEFSDGGLVIPGEPGLSLGLSVAVVVSGFAAAGLVFFLLIRNGEGLSSIGLSRDGWRRDLGYLLPVWVLVQVIPQEVGSAILSGAHISRYQVSGPALPTAFVAVGLLMSLQAAVVEEVVVLGYLVRRLEQRGWTTTAVVVIAVLVRISYHLYYGPGVLPILLWATATVFAYRKIRRLLPFIICHFVWDAGITINGYSHTAAATFDGLFFVAALVFLLLWGREDGVPRRRRADPTLLSLP